MSIDTGFKSFGFTDDREEAERWGLLEEKLTSSALPSSKSTSTSSNEDNTEIDGKMEVGDSDWLQDAQKSSVTEYKKKKSSKKQSFYQRNKKQIFDALIVLGVIYVGYKLLFEKEEGFEEGGDIDYAPSPASQVEPIAEPIPQAPPRPELPEATYNPEG